MSSKSKNKPVHEVRLGRIKAAIWENGREARRADGASAPGSTGNGAEAPSRSRASRPENGTRYSVTLSRLYKNGDDEWKDSSSFGRDDLSLVEKVCHMTQLWIFSQTQGGVVQTVPSGDSSESDEF